MKNFESAKSKFIKALADFRKPAVVGKLQLIQFEQSQTFNTKELCFGIKPKDIKVFYNDFVKGLAHLQVQSDNIMFVSMSAAFYKKAKSNSQFTLYLPFELINLFNTIDKQTVTISQYTSKGEAHLYFELPEIDLYFSINVSTYVGMRENTIESNYKYALVNFLKYELELEVLPTVGCLTVQKYKFNSPQYNYTLTNRSVSSEAIEMDEKELKEFNTPVECKCHNIPIFGQPADTAFQKQYLNFAFTWLKLSNKNANINLYIASVEQTRTFAKGGLFINPKNESWAYIMPIHISE